MPFTAISYNTIPFAKAKLDEMVNEGYILDYVLVPHQADEDDRKDHRHELIFPNKTIDLAAFKNRLKEFDPNNPTKPLTTGQINTCNSIDDFVLYTLHDSAYLAWKDMSRNIVDYPKDIVITSDQDLYDGLYYHAYNESEFAKHSRRKQLLDDPNIKTTSLIGTHYPLQMIGPVIAYRKQKKEEAIEDEYKKRLESKECAVNLPSPPELTEEQKKIIDLRTKTERIMAEKEKALRESFDAMLRTKL